MRLQEVGKCGHPSATGSMPLEAGSLLMRSIAIGASGFWGANLLMLPIFSYIFLLGAPFDPFAPRGGRQEAGSTSPPGESSLGSFAELQTN